MPGTLDHGPRLSGVEYDRRVTELYLKLPDNPSAEEEQLAKRREFDLRIDHRLGIHFPEERREALWRVNVSMSRRPIRMLLAWRFGRSFPRLLAATARRLASKVIKEYRSVLTPQELDQFFGEDEIASPGLPVDRSTRPKAPR